MVWFLGLQMAHAEGHQAKEDPGVVGYEERHRRVSVQNSVNVRDKRG